MLPRLGNGWRSAFVRRCSGADVQKCLCGDDGSEKTVSFDAAFKVSEIYEHGADGHVGSNMQTLHFACDLFLDFVPDLVLAFRFNDICRAGRLDQEIDLASAAVRVRGSVDFCRFGDVPGRRSGMPCSCAKARIGLQVRVLGPKTSLAFLFKTMWSTPYSGVKMQYCNFTPVASVCHTLPLRRVIPL